MNAIFSVSIAIILPQRAEPDNRKIGQFDRVLRDAQHGYINYPKLHFQYYTLIN